VIFAVVSLKSTTLQERRSLFVDAIIYKAVLIICMYKMFVYYNTV